MLSRVKLVLGIVLIAALSACSGPVTEEAAGQDVAGMANPAAVYCEGLDYEMETVETDAGQDSACVFPDGSQCGQWDFLAGRCGQEFSYCEQQGYDLVEEGTNIGTCVFPDGSSCGEFEYFEGNCGPEA
jgi:putative hemolysin